MPGSQNSVVTKPKKRLGKDSQIRIFRRAGRKPPFWACPQLQDLHGAKAIGRSLMLRVWKMKTSTAPARPTSQSCVQCLLPFIMKVSRHICAVVLSSAVSLLLPLPTPSPLQKNKRGATSGGILDIAIQSIQGGIYDPGGGRRAVGISKLWTARSRWYRNWLSQLSLNTPWDRDPVREGDWESSRRDLHNVLRSTALTSRFLSKRRRSVSDFDHNYY